MLIFLLALLNVSVESKIDSVIIYPNQALVVRKANVTLTGSTQLNFKDLPGMIDDNTVRIKAEGLKIGEVQIKRGYVEKPSPRVKELETKIKDVESDIRDLDNEKEVLKAKETFLGSVKLGAPELIAKELTEGKVAPESWRSGLKFMTDELAKTKSRSAEIDDEKKDLNDTLQALKKELNDVKALTENRKEVIVDVAVTESGSYPVELSYIIPQSIRWSPYYELRASPSESKVGISYFAKISQRTGEDWESVKILLSTATPSIGGVAPEPYPWYLALEEIAPGQINVAAERSVYQRLPVSSLQDLETKAEIEVPKVETGISLQYVIPGRVSLKSGESEKKIALYSASFPAVFEYYIYPKAQPIAYLKGKMLNKTEYIFLAGEANAYVGSEFTGKTRLPSIAPEESTEASFGVDERVKVKHDLVKTFTAKTANKRQKTEFLFKTVVENYHSKPVKFTLVEQIPVSQQKDITVKLTKIEPKFDQENKDTGIFTYTRELKPQEKFTVDLGYFVEYPVGRRVMGLY